MKKNKKKQTLKYIFSDFIASVFAWTIFYIFRKKYIEPQKFGYDIDVQFDNKYLIAVIVIPIFWLLIYYLSGYYKDIYRKSRLKELWNTFSLSFSGVIVIFFMFILDDYVLSYKNYYFSFLALFALQFTLTYIPRLIITTRTIGKLHNKKIGFNTIIVGSNEKAIQLFNNLTKQPKSTGNIFIGFVNVVEQDKYLLEKTLPYLGNIHNIKEIIENNNVEEVIIAIESSEHDKINYILTNVVCRNVVIKVIPTLYDILTGSVHMTNIYSSPLIQITRDAMPEWQINLKRIIDVLFSIIAIIILIPLYIFLMMGVRLSSKGPIFYSHQRIGRFGKPFTIYKFRSMIPNAETNGPALSSKNDPRITKFGLFMRKTRLDELPQFYNVIIGDMSLVGPRPERQFYIDKIMERAPYYSHLQKVRPGITSWGQVKFGYAENVEEMIERLQYDLIYIENMSLYVDFKIMIYTIKIIFQGSGK